MIVAATAIAPPSPSLRQQRYQAREAQSAGRQPPLLRLRCGAPYGQHRRDRLLGQEVELGITPSSEFGMARYRMAVCSMVIMLRTRSGRAMATIRPTIPPSLQPTR